MKKLLYILIASVLVLGACTTAPADNNEATATQTDMQSESEEAIPTEPVEIIHDEPLQFEANMTGDYLLIDVRTPQEFSEGNIEGALLIPVDELSSRLDEIEAYKDKPVLVYCRSGNRSVTASNILIENGFTDVHNLLTGYNGWVNRGN